MDKLIRRLKKIEKELDKVRSSSFIDGWQTSKHARKSKKWDELAKEKFEIIKTLDTLDNCNRELHNDDIFNHGICLKCELSYYK